MGDTYGTMTIINKSKADPEKLLTILNRYVWNADCEEVQRDGDHLYVNGMLRYPSIFPFAKILHDENEEQISRTDPRYDEPTKGEWSVEAGDEVDVDDFIQEMGAELKEGELRVMTNSRHSDGSVTAHDLIIKADQTAKITKISNDVLSGLSHEVYEYPSKNHDA